ncbi:MAG: hypothetical protein ACUVRS_11655 [Armatimonadota bacterium]
MNLEKASQKPACRFPVVWAIGTVVTFKRRSSLGDCPRLVAVGTVVRAPEGNQKSDSVSFI